MIFLRLWFSVLVLSLILSLTLSAVSLKKDQRHCIPIPIEERIDCASSESIRTR